MALLGDASISGVPALGLPKMKHFGGRHFQSGLFRFAAVVDDREQRNPFGLQDAFQSLDRFVHRVMTGPIDDAVVHFRFHEQQNNELKMRYQVMFDRQANALNPRLYFGVLQF